jgi:hypothetical protein
LQTSARDLKFFVLNRGTLSLDAPIQVYLARIRQRDIDEARHPSCSIGLNTPIGHCMGLLAATGYHRVFIVDGQGKPIGVVSITDILRFASNDTAGSSAPPPSASSGSGSGTPPVPTAGSQQPQQPQQQQQSPAAASVSSSSASGSSPSAGSGSPPVAAAAGGVGASPRPVHLRSHSQSQTPVITPAPLPQ